MIVVSGVGVGDVMVVVIIVGFSCGWLFIKFVCLGNVVGVVMLLMLGIVVCNCDDVERFFELVVEFIEVGQD